jgi:hypothetical protein
MEVVAHHRRSYDAGDLVEDPSHIKELKAYKRRARKGAATNILIARVPVANDFLQAIVARGHKFGAAVTSLLRLHDIHGRTRLEAAIAEAIAHDALNVASVRHILERVPTEMNVPPQLQVVLPKDSKAAGIAVRMADFREFDRLLSNSSDDQELKS